MCNKTGKSFGELTDRFILGGDNTNLIADADGDLRIVGEKEKKKHEKKVANYRGSITMYRTGIAAGHNDPTVFLLKGKKRKSGFNETFLRQEGWALGSTICMTENAYMTEEAWEEMAVGQDVSRMVRMSTHHVKKQVDVRQRVKEQIDVRQTKMPEFPYVQHSSAATARVARANMRWRSEHTTDKEQMCEWG